ncbi:hypothetical protein ACEPAG_3357 [Sanghuangporus baumii]
MVLTHSIARNAVIYGDTAGVAADKHTSARSRRSKSSSALKPNITIENKLARSHSRVTVPRSDTAKRPSGQKSSRGTKQQQGHQATKHGRGSPSSTSLAGLSEPIVGGTQKQNGIRRLSKRGTKRNRETDEGAPESEAAPRSNARRVRRRIHRPEDGTGQRAVAVPKVSRASGCDGSSSCQMLRRSARLAPKSSCPVPQGRCLSTEGAEHIVNRSNQTIGKRTWAQECSKNESEEPNLRRIRRRIRVTAGTLGSSSVPSIKNEDTDQDWLLGVYNERDASVDTVTPTYWRNRESSEPRSSSVESLLTPPPPCMEEEEDVLLHQDFDAMIPLDSLPDEDERDAMNQAYLRQLQDHRPDDEADVAAEMADNRYRSLAPEPDQGLPERSMREE